ncbi:glycosyltransferase [candidate division CSSED10-310 bacterium]|uniref:Glycosyltransferase n=1 Tax=candidate division CSSED10-310 bacterium TaxID=2855610 RepID=A0ABV6YXE3_UNCC1
MNEPELTACLIVRDEESVLSTCLKSIQSFVDELIIVDTGSTDQTKQIAEKFQTKLYDFEWCDDFSAARNEALKHATGDWILWIDADEQLDDTEPHYIKSLLTDSSKIAYTVRLFPKRNHTAYQSYRLFRNLPQIQFQGIIHESIYSSLLEVAENTHRETGHSLLAIKHCGYEHHQEVKHKRNMPLLYKRLKEEPTSIRCLWHLGFIQEQLGDETGAEDSWKTAIQVIQKNKEVISLDSLPYAYLIRLYLRKGNDIAALLEEALFRFPKQYELIWIKAQLLKSTHQYHDALNMFKQLIRIDPNSLVDQAIAYDYRIFQVLSYEPIGDCCYKLGRYKDSIAYYRKAEQVDPSKIEFYLKRSFVENLEQNKK